MYQCSTDLKSPPWSKSPSWFPWLILGPLTSGFPFFLFGRLFRLSSWPPDLVVPGSDRPYLRTLKYNGVIGKTYSQHDRVLSSSRISVNLCQRSRSRGGLKVILVRPIYGICWWRTTLVEGFLSTYVKRTEWGDEGCGMYLTSLSGVTRCFEHGRTTFGLSILRDGH